MNKGITRVSIVTAAPEILDDKDMDALTVRALAARLDVQREAWLGEAATRVKEAAHLHDEGDRRFAAHLDG
ncbi:hypothetical protein [Nonomuraea wenchangensis]|uniref:hypothetical protein n=1 Tax=Nonomuraea wenchangensis TaxID=568860 RepID=UPI0037B4F635